MDSVTLTIILVSSLTMDVLGFMGKKAGWAIFPLFGALVGAIGTLALMADGNLTNTGTTIAAANANFVSDFNAITVIAIAVSVSGGIIGIRRAFNI